MIKLGQHTVKLTFLQKVKILLGAELQVIQMYAMPDGEYFDYQVRFKCGKVGTSSS